MKSSSSISGGGSYARAVVKAIHDDDNNNDDDADAGAVFPTAVPVALLAARRHVAAAGSAKTAAGATTTFADDFLQFTPGSIPHSMIAATAIGVACGTAAWIYYAVLEWALEVAWKRLPEHVFGLSHESSGASVFPAILWIPFMVYTMATCVGLTVVTLGEPVDLAYTMHCVHVKGYIGLKHVPPMLVASLCSIVAGGSLGPEAPLVCMCAALASYLSRRVLRTTDRHLIRKHTIMGMASALAAFFGCPLGGSLFAMEVCSRFGFEYFEHAFEAIAAGLVSLSVFRYAAGLPIQAIWDITDAKLPGAEPVHICYGAALGLVGAGVAYLYALFRFHVLRVFQNNNLLETKNAVQRAWVGATVIAVLGMLIPQTLFWGEFEFQAIATMAPASELPHVWPATSLIQFEMHNYVTALTVGVAKLIAIAFSVAAGFRGGFIFPLFSAAAALGRAIHFLAPNIPVQLCVLCMAAAVNVAVTRTAMATTLILAFLAGEPNTIASILAASLVSLFVTSYMPFIANPSGSRGYVDNMDTSARSVTTSCAPSAAVLGNNGDSDSGEIEVLAPFSDVHTNNKHTDEVHDKYVTRSTLPERHHV